MDTGIVISVLVVYKILLIGIGLWAQRRTRDSTDFFLGGRGLGAIVAAISYSASAASAWTLLGVSGITYVIGLSAVWIVFGTTLGCIIAWGWIAPRMMRYSRAGNIITLTEFLADQATVTQRRHIIRFASLIILFSFIFYISSQFQGAGNTFASTFGMASADSIILGGIIIMVYTLLGGFWAVSVTDTLQGILMAVTAVLLPVAAWSALGGWQPFWEQLALVSSADQLSLTGSHLGLFALGIIFGNLAIGIGTFGQPHLLARFMALRDQKALVQGRIIAITWYSLVFCGMFFLGLAGRILIPTLDNPETLFFALTEMLFSPFFGALLLAAVLSAIMSTADSMLLVAAASVSHDLGLGRRFPGKDLLISRCVIGALCFAAIWVAIVLPASIFQRVLFAWIAIGSAFGPLVFVRLAGVAVSGRAALASMVVGFASAVALYLLPNTTGDIAERLLPFCAALLTLIWLRHPDQVKTVTSSH